MPPIAPRAPRGVCGEPGKQCATCADLQTGPTMPSLWTSAADPMPLKGDRSDGIYFQLHA